MSIPLSVYLNLPDEAATRELAACLASVVGAGDTLALSGSVGAGKSVFARALIQKLQGAHGPVEDVPSPSFTLVQTYYAGPLEIWHCDLYRLTGPGEVLELGLDDAFETAVTLIEWPDRLGAELPGDALHLSFALGSGENERVVHVTCAGTRWTDRLGVLGAFKVPEHLDD